MQSPKSSSWKISKKNLILHKAGKSQINARLDVLRGRSITAFPDIDGYSTWVEKLAQLEGFSYTVCDLLVKYGKPEDHEAHIDIADWLIRWHRTPQSPGRCYLRRRGAVLLPGGP